MNENVWVIEQFGDDGFRAVIQVYESDTAAIEYLKLSGTLALERRVNGGRKEIIVKLAEYPKASFRISCFEVKTANAR